MRNYSKSGLFITNVLTFCLVGQDAVIIRPIPFIVLILTFASCDNSLRSFVTKTSRLREAK